MPQNTHYLEQPSLELYLAASSITCGDPSDEIDPISLEAQVEATEIIRDFGPQEVSALIEDYSSQYVEGSSKLSVLDDMGIDVTDIQNERQQKVRILKEMRERLGRRAKRTFVVGVLAVSSVTAFVATEAMVDDYDSNEPFVSIESDAYLVPYSFVVGMMATVLSTPKADKFAYKAAHKRAQKASVK